MSIVVGLEPNPGDPAGLHLAPMIARSTGQPLVLCCVVPDPWESSTLLGGGDPAWREHLHDSAAEAVDTALAALADDLIVETVTRAGRSVPRALLEEANQREASVLVLGSSTAGPLGHIALGSVTDRLVHSADLPVVIAPRGYRRVPADHRIRRVVVAITADDQSHHLVRAAGTFAALVDAPVELLSFAIRQASPQTTAGEGRVDDLAFAAWVRDTQQAQREAAQALEAGTPRLTVSGQEIVVAPGWAAALDQVEWRSGDLLVVGSSRYGPLARVFLGSTGACILRQAPVPVVVVPRR